MPRLIRLLLLVFAPLLANAAGFDPECPVVFPSSVADATGELIAEYDLGPYGEVVRMRGGGWC